MSVNLKQIAELVSGEIVGDPSTVVSGVSSINEAGPGDLVFADSKQNLSIAESSAAAAVLTRHQSPSCAKPVVMVSDPRQAFAAVLKLFAPKLDVEPGIHEAAYVAPSVRVGQNVSVGFCAYVGANAALGDNVTISPFAYVGEGVTVEEGSVIYPHVTLYPGCRIGRNVFIHSGCVIGADGFGYHQVNGRHQKVTHIGGVIIEDDVEIGANVTIDRASTGYTQIGQGTKIDNLCHVAHNVRIGPNCILVAQVGISGSVDVGANVVLAGQAGVKDHVRIGDNSQIAARAGIISDIKPGSKIAGYPSRPYGDEMRIWASLSRLPELIRHVKVLEARLAALEGQGGEDVSAGEPAPTGDPGLESDLP